MVKVTVTQTVVAKVTSNKKKCSSRVFLLQENVTTIAMTSGSDSIEFKLQNTLRCHTKPVNHLAISQGCSRLISIGTFSSSFQPLLSVDKHLGDDARVVVWSVTSGEKLFVAERPFNGAATAVAWASRDTSRFVVGFASGDLHLFRSENGKVMKGIHSSVALN